MRRQRKKSLHIYECSWTKSSGHILLETDYLQFFDETDWIQMVSTIKAPAFLKDCTFRLIKKKHTCVLLGLYYMITPLWQASSFECLWKAIEVMKQKGGSWGVEWVLQSRCYLGILDDLSQGIQVLHPSFLSIFNLANSLFIEYTRKRVLILISDSFTISIREEKREKCLSSTNLTVQWINSVECSKGERSHWKSLPCFLNECCLHLCLISH